MNRLRTIDPLKGLKGKLNFIKFQRQPVYQILKFINSIVIRKQDISSRSQNKNAQNSSSLDKYSLDDIQALKNNNNFTPYDYKKLIFQSHVHQNADPSAPVGTIYQQLDRHQKRLVLSLLKFSDKLNTRQISYLNYALRAKLNSVYPNWNNLHFNPQCNFKRQFVLTPNFSYMQNLNDVKVVPKKKVTSTIISLRKVEQPPKQAQKQEVKSKAEQHPKKASKKS